MSKVCTLTTVKPFSEAVDPFSPMGKIIERVPDPQERHDTLAALADLSVEKPWRVEDYLFPSFVK